MKSSERDKTINEANSYIELGKLLKKGRSLKQQSYVQEIVERNISTEEKISLIKGYDESEEKRLAKIEETKVQDRKRNIEVVDKKDIYSDIISQLDENTGNPKRLIILSYFKYLFTHYGRISRFGKMTQTLESNLFPIRHVLRRSVLQYLMFVLKPSLNNLLSVLWFISEEGWKYLTRFEYNLCMSFYNFCYTFSLSLNEKKKVYENILKNQKLFLRLWIDEKYFDTLNNILDKSIPVESEYFKYKEQYKTDLSIIFNHDKREVNLKNIILAMSMMEYRSFITFEDLMYTINPPSIVSNKFECSEEVQRKIEKYIQIKEDELLDYVNELRFIEFYKTNFIQSYIVQDIYMFNSAFSNLEEKKKLFKTAQKDIFKFTEKIFGNFLFIFEDYLAYKIEIVDIRNNVSQVKLFDQHIQTLMTVIKAYYKEIELALQNNSQIKNYKYSFEDYQQYLENSEITDKSKNIELFKILFKSSETFVELGRSIYKKIAASADFELLTLSEKVQKIKENSVFVMCVPHLNKSIRLNNYLYDKTVLEAGILAMDFCFNMAIYFKNTEVLNAIFAESTVKNKVMELSTILQRLKKVI